MTDETSDETKALMAAMAKWVDSALTRATVGGRKLASQMMWRKDADLAIAIELKAGTARLYACVPGSPPIEIASATLPPLRPHKAATENGEPVH